MDTKQGVNMEKKETPFRVELWDGHPGRWIIKAKDSEKIIDNANGYGYKNAQNAYKAGWYKFSGGKDKVSKAKSWWRKHKEFCNALSDEMFYIMKDNAGLEGDVNSFDEDVREAALTMAEHLGIDDFKVEYLKHMP